MKKYFRVLKIVFILVVVVTIGAYGVHVYQEYQAEKEAAENVIKVACVGDSNTYRHGGKHAKEYMYSYHLAKMLGEDYVVKNFGEVGTCVNSNGENPYNTLRVYEEGKKYNADILIIMLGTNDVWDHNWVSEEFFKQEYLKLIDSYLQTENIPEIYLCTLPKLYQEDGSVSEEGFGARIEMLSNVVREVAKERGYNVIEINQVTDNHLEWYEGDYLHVNKEGAKGIATAMAEAIKSSINKEGLENEVENK